MIEHLRGNLILKEPGHVVVECAGVGYGLQVPHSTFQVLPDVGAEVALWVHFQMRETEIALCGFATEAERALFRTFIGVQSIGPKLALVLLSTLTPDELIHAVLEQDLTLLTSVPGIGKKTAERIVIELREPLRKIAKAAKPTASAEADDLEGEPVDGISRDMRDQAVASLIALGTKPAIAARAIQKATRTLTDEPTVETLVKEGLRHR